jgi:PhnB protein
MKLNPYLAFNGNCAEAFKFYETALGGKVLVQMTYGESPMAGQSPPEMKDRIMHVSMQVGDTVLMGGDAPPQMYKAAQGITISINVDDPAEADKAFNALAAGGTIGMPIQETFWAKRFGMVTDKFGTPWMVNCAKPL